MTEKVIEFNIGGMIFEATLGLLSNNGRSYFESSLFGSIKDSDGLPFIDRCPELFAAILVRLRKGYLENYKLIDKKKLAKEIEFYNVNLPNVSSGFKNKNLNILCNIICALLVIFVYCILCLFFLIYISEFSFFNNIWLLIVKIILKILLLISNYTK